MGHGMKDQELKAFLQKHQPLPPAAEPGELEAIFARIEGKERRPRRSLLLFLGAPAAAAALVFVLLGSPPQPAPGPAAQVAAYEDEAAFLSEELPDQEVGEGYLRLAGLGN